jgi:glyoxylase-like metal-dependent hydrolase (beta-lactamase superfamily II)/ferredoxin
MASRTRAFADNAAGDWFVDQACIDCDTCRQLAPATFADAGGHARVACQPVDAAATADAARAALSCPTGAIGSGGALPRGAAATLPWPLDERVRYCGYTSASSYGASSYLLQHPQGNWLIDAPRWVPALAEAIAGLGGLAGIFLTHRDDVADAARYARRFQARRVIHRADADAMPDAEQVLDGDAAVAVAAGLTALPLPGHTAGSMALLADDTYAFTGDHVWWSRVQQRLVASRSVCWHSWSAQTRSMERLAGQRFRALLPGHGGRRLLADAATMQAEVAAVAARMRADGDADAW